MEQERLFITGATSGIGLAICTEARARGMHLLAHHRNKEVEGKLHELLEQDPLSFSMSADLSKQGEIESLCQEIQAKNISLSWIIHAAGMIDANEKGTEISNERMLECFQVNTFAPMRITSLLEPLVPSSGGAIFIGSVAGIWGNSGFPVYSATKAALHNFSLSLSRKWSDRGSKSIVVAPGATNTRMREKTAGDAASSQCPEVVASVVLDIVTGTLNAANGDIVTVSNGVASKLVPPTRN